MQVSLHKTSSKEKEALFVKIEKNVLMVIFKNTFSAVAKLIAI